MFKVDRELFELRFPESAVVIYPFQRGAHRLRIEASASHAPLFFYRGQPRILQDANVLRDSRQRHVESCGELADRSLEFRYVFRNYPLVDLHANAMNAALVAESAADDVFWKLHLALFENQDALDPERLIAYAVKTGVPEARARNGLHGSTRPKVEGDLSSGERSGVQGTPAFFVNGRRHGGDWSNGSLADAIARVGA